MSVGDRAERTVATQRGLRRTAAAAGALYLATFVTSIPTLALYASLRDHAGFVLGAGASAGVAAGAVCEVALALCCVATAVVLLPVLRPRGPVAAVGFLSARFVEAGMVLVGVATVRTLLALRADAPTGAAHPEAMLAVGRALLAGYDATFLLGQSLMPVVSAVCLGSVLLRSGLVPRGIPLLGLLGAPVLLASDVAVLLGVLDQRGAVAAAAALPIALWELLLGCWLLAKGFLPTAPGPVDRLSAEAGLP